ncbi:hypothetical protein LZ30DRAFT_769849 [Colletotrichum cereale]|nr:hypothetical protein LZ30DRAFT_769849 [Colletotrichum cereale]
MGMLPRRNLASDVAAGGADGAETASVPGYLGGEVLAVLPAKALSLMVIVDSVTSKRAAVLGGRTLVDGRNVLKIFQVGLLRQMMEGGLLWSATVGCMCILLQQVGYDHGQGTRDGFPANDLQQQQPPASATASAAKYGLLLFLLVLALAFASYGRDTYYLCIRTLYRPPI